MSKKKKKEQNFYRLRDAFSSYQQKQTNPRNWKQASLDKARKKKEDTYERNNPSAVNRFNEARKKMNLAPKRPVEDDYKEMFGRSRMLENKYGTKSKSLVDTGTYNRWKEYYKKHPERSTPKQEAGKPFKYSYKGQKKVLDKERKNFNAQEQWLSTNKKSIMARQAKEKEAAKYKAKRGSWQDRLDRSASWLNKTFAKPVERFYEKGKEKKLAPFLAINKGLKAAAYVGDKYDKYVGAGGRNLAKRSLDKRDKAIADIKKKISDPKKQKAAISRYDNRIDLKGTLSDIKKSYGEAWTKNKRADTAELQKRVGFKTRSKVANWAIQTGIEAALDPTTLIGGAAGKATTKGLKGLTRKVGLKSEAIDAATRAAEKAAEKAKVRKSNISKLSPEGAEAVNLSAAKRVSSFGKKPRKIESQLLLPAPTEEAIKKNRVRFTAKDKGLKYKLPTEEAAFKNKKRGVNVYGVREPLIKDRKTLGGKYETPIPEGRNTPYSDRYHEFISQAEKPTVDKPHVEFKEGSRKDKIQAILDTFPEKAKVDKPDMKELDKLSYDILMGKTSKAKDKLKAAKTPRQKATARLALDKAEHDASEFAKKGQRDELDAIRDIDKQMWQETPEAKNMRDEIDSHNRKLQAKGFEIENLREHDKHYQNMLDSIGKDPKTGKQMRINLGDAYDDYADLMPKHLIAKKGSKSGVPLDVYLEENRNIFGVKGTEEDFLERLNRGYQARQELKNIPVKEQKDAIRWDRFKNPDEHMNEKYLESEQGQKMKAQYDALDKAKMMPDVPELKDLPVTDKITDRVPEKAKGKAPKKRLTKKQQEKFMQGLVEDADLRNKLARDETMVKKEIPAATPLDQMQEQWSKFAGKKEGTFEDLINKAAAEKQPKARTQYKEGAGPILKHQHEANEKIRALVNDISKWGKGEKGPEPTGNIGKELVRGEPKGEPLQFKKELIASKKADDVIPRPDYHQITPDMPDATRKLLEAENKKIANDYQAKLSQVEAIKKLENSVKEPELHPIDPNLPDATKQVLQKENDRLTAKYESDRAKVSKQVADISAKLGIQSGAAEEVAATITPNRPRGKVEAENINAAPSATKQLDPTTAPLTEVLEPNAKDLPEGTDTRGMISEQINRDPVEKETAKQKVLKVLKEGPNKFYRKFVDSAYGITNAEKKLGGDVNSANSATGLAHRAKSSSIKSEQELVDGFYDKDGNKIGDSYKDTVEYAKDYDKTIDFMVAARIHDYDAKQLKALGSGDYRQLDMANEAIIAAVKENPNIVNEALKVQEFIKNQQQVLKEGGIFNDAQIEQMWKDHPNYIKMERDFSEQPEDFSGRTGTGTGGANPIKSLKGTTTERRVNDPATTMMRTQYLYNAIAEQNKVGMAFKKLIEGNGGNDFAEVVDMEPNYAYKLKNKVDEHAQNADEMVPKDQEDFTKFFQPHDEKNMVYVYENGNRYKIKIHDKDLYESMVRMNSKQSDWLVNAISTPAAVLRKGVTIAPDFSLRNWFRDQFMTAAVSDVNYIPFVDSYKGWKEIMKDKKLRKTGEGYSKILAAYKRNGGETSAITDLDHEGIMKQYAEIAKDPNIKQFWSEVKQDPKKLLTAPFIKSYEKLKGIGELSEQSTRIGHMMKAAKKGQSLEEAAYTARKAMDFQRGGDWAKNYNKIDAFFNATIQGLDVFGRALVKHPVRTSATLGASVTAPTVALWFNNQDEDWYNEIPLKDRDRNWYYKIPNTGQVIQAPKPFEAGILFGSSVERALDLAKAVKNGEKLKDAREEAFAKYGQSLIDAFTPDIMPTALKPVFETWANKSLSFGTPIDTMGDMLSKNPSARQSAYSTEIAKATSRAIEKVNPMTEISPKDVDNIIRGYTGSMGTFANEQVDNFLHTVNPNLPKRPEVTVQQIPFLRSFYLKNLDANNRSTEQFYDTFAKLKRQGQIAKTYNKDFDKEKYNEYNRVLRSISEKTTEKRKIMNDKNMSSAEKTKKIRQLNKELTEFAKNAPK